MQSRLSSRSCLWLFLVLLLAPALHAQDCNGDGIPDTLPPAQMIAIGDELTLDSSAVFNSLVGVAGNDTLNNNQLYLVDPNDTSNPHRNSIIIVSGPQHGNSTTYQSGAGMVPGQLIYSFSGTGQFSEIWDCIQYRLQDQCGNLSNIATLRIRIVSAQTSINKALNFTGSSWMIVPDSASLDLSNALTIEAWVKPTVLGSAMTIVSKWGDSTPAGDRSYAVEIMPDGSVQFGLARNDNQNDGSFHAFFTGQLTAGLWHHIACTYNGVERRTYIDGQLVGTRATTGLIHPGTTHLSIGAHLHDNAANPSDVNQYFQGTIDRVKIWNTARTQSEIRFSMTRREITAPFPSPVSVWELDNNFSDAVGSNPGALNGTGGSFVSALDIPRPIFDCNANGCQDSYDLSFFNPAQQPNPDLNGNGVLDSCEQYSLYCFGDGSALPCPCSNFGVPGHGCGNSVNAQGSQLRGQGNASLSADTLLLVATGMPASTTLFSQTESRRNYGLGFTLGDGILCVTGPLIRLGVVANNASGTGTYPGSGGIPVSVKGLVPPGATRFYQGRYRDAAASFCAPETWNLTNGVEVHWGP